MVGVGERDAPTAGALAMIDEPGIGLYLPEVCRLRGLCLLALDRNNKTDARDAFQAAHATANRQGAVLFAPL